MSIKKLGKAAVKPQCDVCGHLKSIVRLLACNHSWCDDCLDYNFRLSLDDRSCMPPKCCKVIPFEVVDHMFDRSFKQRWHDRLAEVMTKDKLYCPDPKCAKWITPANISEDPWQSGRKFGRCTHCRIIACGTCKGIYHRDSKCPEDPDAQWLDALAKREGWQGCPKCGMLIERDGGCSHVECLWCGSELCVLCGADWNTCDCTESTADEENEDREHILDRLPSQGHEEADPTDLPGPAPGPTMRGALGGLPSLTRRPPVPQPHASPIRRSWSDSDLSRFAGSYWGPGMEFAAKHHTSPNAATAGSRFFYSTEMIELIVDLRTRFPRLSERPSNRPFGDPSPEPQVSSPATASDWVNNPPPPPHDEYYYRNNPRTERTRNGSPHPFGAEDTFRTLVQDSSRTRHASPHPFAENPELYGFHPNGIPRIDWLSLPQPRRGIDGTGALIEYMLEMLQNDWETRSNASSESTVRAEERDSGIEDIESAIREAFDDETYDSTFEDDDIDENQQLAVPTRAAQPQTPTQNPPYLQQSISSMWGERYPEESLTPRAPPSSPTRIWRERWDDGPDYEPRGRTRHRS